MVIIVVRLIKSTTIIILKNRLENSVPTWRCWSSLVWLLTLAFITWKVLESLPHSVLYTSKLEVVGYCFLYLSICWVWFFMEKHWIQSLGLFLHHWLFPPSAVYTLKDKYWNSGSQCLSQVRLERYSCISFFSSR